MSNVLFSRAGVVLLSTSVLLAGTTVITPAFATGGATYGLWSEVTEVEQYVEYSGSVDFTGSGISNATYVTTFVDIGGVDISENGVSTRLNDTQFLSAETPFGAIFGASGPSETNNLLEIDGADYAAAPPYERSNTVITFDSPVPANRLGIAIGDLDYDEVQIEARDSGDNLLTYEQLVGTSTDNTFNLCNVTTLPDTCDAATDVEPEIATDGPWVDFFPNEDPNGDGESGWIFPSAEIKSITIDHLSSGSSIRIWLAAINEVTPTPTPTPTPTLATTGSTFGSEAIWFALSLGALGIASIAFAGSPKRRKA